MNYDMVGPALALGLSAIGSSVGCCIPGMASHAVMSRTSDSHGKFLILSAAPSTMILYGFILMIFMKNAIQAGTLSPFSGVVIGTICGLAIAVAGIYQGKVAATGIQAVAKDPSLFGKCMTTVGILESMGLFPVVFALLIM